MKKISILFGILCALLVLTWVLTESKLLDQSYEIENKLQAALRNPQSYQLPQASLVFKEGYWQSSKGVVLRAELLDELHRSLESIKISRVIKNPSDYKSFFSNDLNLKINDSEFSFGEMSVSMDSFYLGMRGDPDVYVMDLDDLGSIAVGDNENVLRQAKYQRMKDLLNFPEHGWQETRLFYILRRSGFQKFKKESISLDPAQLSKRIWGNDVIKYFVSGLQSLEIHGEISAKKPEGLKLIGDWELTQPDGTKEVWQFFPHPQVDLIVVWIESLQRAYPLSEESSELIKSFPERLVTKPFVMQLKLAEDKISFSPALDLEKEKLIDDFLSQKQTFDSLSVQVTCQTKEGVEMSFGQVSYRLIRKSESWLIQDCETGLEWLYRPSVDSPLDFSLDSL